MARGEERAVFPIEPPIRGDWVILDEVASALLLTRLRETNFFKSEDHPKGPVRIMKLEFYPGWMLCDFPIAPRRDGTESEEKPPVASEALGRGAHSLLFGPDGFTALTGNSLPIHEHNRLHGIFLETRTALDSYFRFFCFFIRGEDGPFEVVSARHKLLLAADGDGVRKPARITSPKLVRMLGPKDAAFRATICYGDRLHKAKFAVDAGGNVSMLDDTVVETGVTRVPALTFINTLRFESGGPSNG